jgi:hypothetical protein
MRFRIAWLLKGFMGLSGLGLPCAGQPVSRAQADSGWVSLFNGRDLSGLYIWQELNGRNHDTEGIVLVDAGMLHFFKENPDRAALPFGYLATEKSYGNYRTRVEFKYGTKTFIRKTDGYSDTFNSGFLFHMVGEMPLAGGWHPCVEFQFKQGDMGDLYLIQDLRATVNGKDITGRSPALIDAERDGWNTAEMIVRGNDSFEFILNGKTVNRATRIAKPDGSPLFEGRIGLEIENGEIWFRNWVLMDLDAPVRAHPGPLRARGGDTRLGAARVSPDGKRLPARWRGRLPAIKVQAAQTYQ